MGRETGGDEDRITKETAISRYSCPSLITWSRPAGAGPGLSCSSVAPTRPKLWRDEPMVPLSRGMTGGHLAKRAQVKACRRHYRCSRNSRKSLDKRAPITAITTRQIMLKSSKLVTQAGLLCTFWKPSHMGPWQFP